MGRLASLRGWIPGRRWSYAVVGFLLALGAPAGLAIVRAAEAGVAPGPTFLKSEVLNDPLLYQYLTLSTTLVFVLCAFLLGREADRLAAESTTDGLTGLANRRRFEATLAKELALGKRRYEPLCVLLFDLDHLKLINDRGGHAAGDTALRVVGRTLASRCRATDLPARIGGDEFAVLAPRTGIAEAIPLANRVREGLAAAADGSPVTVSVGVAESRPGSTARELLTLADGALYRAKTLGRDRVDAG